MTIRKLYLDMDGVLADFERGVLELAGMQPTPLNGKRDAHYDDRMWQAIQRVDHFYARLEPIPGALEMFAELCERYGNRCEILTGIPKPRRNILHAREDKLEWVKRVLRSNIRVNVVLREEKPDFCTGPDCVLVDDSIRNIKEWEKKGGTGVLFEGAQSALIQIQQMERS